MESLNIITIIVIIVTISYIHKLIHKYISKKDDISLDPLKHDIYKQITVDITTIIMLYFIYNRNNIDIPDLINHIIVGSFGYFIFYHIVQPFIIKTAL